jgi:hypothetical protein
MFADLEAEVVSILKANLSPGLVAADHIVAGPIAPPAAANFPTVSFAVVSFQVIPADDQQTPPREVKNPNTDTFPAATGTTLTLTHPPPLEPLRSIVVTPPAGSSQVLRERDDYTVDYVNGIVRLRLPPEGNVQVEYFSRRSLQVIAATRLRATGRLSVWANPAAATNGMVQVSLTAVGTLLSNAINLNGFISRAENIADSGLASIGVRQAFLIFETPLLSLGQETGASQWDVDLTFPVWIVLVPADEPTGVIRHIATSLSWDGKLAQSVLAAIPKVMGRAVTDVAGVDAGLATALAARGIATIGDLAAAQPIGPAAANAAIEQARTIRSLADKLIGEMVLAQPRIDDLPGFLAQTLAAVNLAGLGMAPAAVTAITADAASLAAACSAPLTFADLFAA